MYKVLLLNGENVQTVCMARALHKLGHSVNALCSSRISSGYATKYIDHRYFSPQINSNSSIYFENFFYNHIESHQYDIIIPMGDESAYFLSLNKDKIESKFNTICAIPPFEVFEKANDKGLLMCICECNMLPHPRTKELCFENIYDTAEYIGFPALIKPNLSAGAKGIVKVNNIKELQRKFKEIETEFGSCTLQEYIEQPDYYYNVMLFRDKHGKNIASTVIKIRRFFPLKGGSSCYSETVEHSELVSKCMECLDILNWEGFADFDILEDVKTGDLKIIEINPRVPSSLQASFSAGINFAEIYIKNYLESAPVYPDYTYESGKQVRWFGLDAMWFVMSPNRFKFKPSWFNFFGKNISYHDGTLSDPMPMIAGILSGIIKYMNPSFRRAKLKS